MNCHQRFWNKTIILNTSERKRRKLTQTMSIISLRDISMDHQPRSLKRQSSKLLATGFTAKTTLTGLTMFHDIKTPNQSSKAICSPQWMPMAMFQDQEEETGVTMMLLLLRNKIIGFQASPTHRKNY